jgi:hypothetical protein
MADEMPFESEVLERLDLREGLLNAIFAEDALPGRSGGADVVSAEGLGNGDERDA